MNNFNTIYNNNVDYLLAMCFKKRIAAQDAEDIVASVFVSFWRNREKIIQGKERAWLTITLCNKVRDFVRKEKTKSKSIVTSIDIDALSAIYDDSHADRERLFRLLLSGVEKLNKRPRKILELYLSGYQTGQIAKILNTKRQNVYNQKNNAIIFLREYLKPHL